MSIVVRRVFSPLVTAQWDLDICSNFQKLIGRYTLFSAAIAAAAAFAPRPLKNSLQQISLWSGGVSLMTFLFIEWRRQKLLVHDKYEYSYGHGERLLEQVPYLLMPISALGLLGVAAKGITALFVKKFSIGHQADLWASRLFKPCAISAVTGLTMLCYITWQSWSMHNKKKITLRKIDL